MGFENIMGVFENLKMWRGFPQQPRDGIWSKPKKTIGKNIDFVDRDVLKRNELVVQYFIWL